jgi:hypothetical protein
MDETTPRPRLLSPQELEEYLDVLKDAGVQEFSGLGLHVSFTPYAPGASEAPYVRVAEREKAKNERDSDWNHKSLWPNGVPPQFPNIKKA